MPHLLTIQINCWPQSVMTVLVPAMALVSLLIKNGSTLEERKVARPLMISPKQQRTFNLVQIMLFLLSRCLYLGMDCNSITQGKI